MYFLDKLGKQAGAELSPARLLNAIKDEDDLKNEDNLINKDEGNLQNEKWRHIILRGVSYTYLKKTSITSYLDSQSKSDPKPEILSAVHTGNRIQSDGRNECGIVEKTTL